MTIPIQKPDTARRIADTYGLVGTVKLRIGEDITPVAIVDSLIPDAGEEGGWAAASASVLPNPGELGAIELQTQSTSTDLLIHEVKISAIGDFGPAGAANWHVLVTTGIIGGTPFQPDTRTWLDRRASDTTPGSRPTAVITPFSTLAVPDIGLWSSVVNAVPGHDSVDFKGRLRLTDSRIAPIGPISITNQIVVLLEALDLPFQVSFMWRETPSRRQSGQSG